MPSYANSSGTWRRAIGGFGREKFSHDSYQRDPQRVDYKAQRDCREEQRPPFPARRIGEIGEGGRKGEQRDESLETTARQLHSQLVTAHLNQRTLLNSLQ